MIKTLRKGTWHGLEGNLVLNAFLISYYVELGEKNKIEIKQLGPNRIVARVSMLRSILFKKV